MELYYFGARYYDAATGVWLTQDVYRGQVEQPLTLHRTLYVLANPVNNVDAYGYAVIANGYGGSGGGSTPVSPQQPTPSNPARPDNYPYEWVPERGGGRGGGRRDEPEDKIGALSLLAQPSVLEPWAYELQQPQIQASSVLDVDDYVELPGEVVADWAGHRILNTGLGLTEGVVNWAQDPVRETRFGILVGPNLNDWREAYAEGSRMWEAAGTGDAEYEWGWSTYRLYLDVTGMRDPVVGLASHVAEAGYAGGRLRDSDLSDYERTWAFLDVAAFSFEVGSTVAGGYSLVRGAGAAAAAGAAASPLDEMAGAMAASPLDEMAEGYAAIPANRALVPYDPEFAAWQAAHSGDVGRAAYLLYESSGAGFTGAEADYILRASSGEYDSLLNKIECHGAALGREGRVGGLNMPPDEGGTFLEADPSFRLQGRHMGQNLEGVPENLQPGDLLTYHRGSPYPAHSNRFLGTWSGEPIFFGKAGFGEFTVSKFNEVIDTWNPESINVYRR